MYVFCPMFRMCVKGQARSDEVVNKVGVVQDPEAGPESVREPMPTVQMRASVHTRVAPRGEPIGDGMHADG